MSLRFQIAVAIPWIHRAVDGVWMEKNEEFGDDWLEGGSGRKEEVRKDERRIRLNSSRQKKRGSAEREES